MLKRIPQNRQDPVENGHPTGKALCCEKSFLRRGIDTHQYGWERVPGPINADIVKKYYA